MRLAGKDSSAIPCSGGFLREQMRGFHDLPSQPPHLSVHVFGMELILNGLPNDAIHVLGLSGEDGSIVKLNAVSQVDVTFSHS
jgi:hypothetical protein